MILFVISVNVLNIKDLLIPLVITNAKYHLWLYTQMFVVHMLGLLIWLDIDGLSFLLIVSRTTGAYLMQNKVIFTC